MTGKSKIVLAVFAVALMLGCTLVPFTAASNDADITVTTNEQKAEGMTLADIIEKIRNIGDAENFELGKVMFIKMNSGEPTEKYQIPQYIDKTSGNAKIEEGYYAVLGDSEYGYKDYHFSDKKYVEICKGGMLEIFPLDDNNTGFEISNEIETEKYFRTIVIAHSGSIIKIFGMAFVIVYDDNGKLEDEFMPLGLTYSSDEGKTTGDYPSAIFAYKYDSAAAEGENFTLTLTLNYVAKLYISNAYIYGKIDAHPDPDFIINGRIESTSNTINFTDCTITLDMRHGGVTMKGSIVIDYLRIGVDVKIQGSPDIEVVTNDVLIDFKFHFVKFTYDSGSSGVLLTIDNENRITPAYSTGNVGIKFVNDIKNLKRTTEVKTNEAINLDIGNISVILDPGEAASVEIVATNFDIRIDSIKFNLVLDGTGSHIDGEAKADVTVSAEEFKVSGIAFRQITITLESIKDLRITTILSMNISNSNNWTIKANKISIGGTVDKVLPFGGDVPILGNYKVTFDVDVTDFSIVKKRGHLTFSGNVDATLSTTDNGLVKTAVVKIEGIEAKKLGEKSYDVNIERVYLKNELPLKNMLKNIVTLADNIEIEVEAKTISVVDKEIDADTVTLSYKNFNLINELYLDLEGASAYQDQEYDKVKLYSESVTGYSQYRNQKSNFTMETVVFRAGLFTECTPCMPIAHFFSGKLNFSEGGVIPMWFNLESDVEFHANGLVLTSFGSKSTNMDGAIKIDIDDGNYRNGIKYVDFNGLSIHVHDDENIGCVMTFDLEPNAGGYHGGYIEASKNYVLPDSITPGPEDYVEYEKIGDRMYFTSTIITGCSVIKCKSIGNGPYMLMTENGEVIRDDCHYNEIIPVEPQIGEDFVGYTDGSGKIFFEKDAQGNILYTMPARDVTLIPVYEKAVTPEYTEEEIQVIDARGGDVAHLDGAGEITSESVKTVNIIVTGATISMSKETYNGIVSETTGDIYIKVVEDTTIENQSNNRTTYSITITDGNGTSVTYDGSTVYEVTVNVKAKDVGTFKAYCINDYGQKEYVSVKSYKDCGDGTFDVTFVANHFSTYAVESIPIDQGGTVVATVVLTMLVILAAFALVIGGKYRDKKAKAREAQEVAEGIAFLAMNQGVVELHYDTDRLYLSETKKETVSTETLFLGNSNSVVDPKKKN